ncbi:MAG: hypothetical protein HGJ94_14090 [Desulfosarcina sp.]|nr:hypothetical protein [Desulfosarcina sp.]MBC2741538.1 hypothetical protein [Desulfosarcina sp.]MBC2764452.1 hypothetical protein [Desulfosarcina sp.]
MSAYFLKKNLRELGRTPADTAATPTADRMVADAAGSVARRSADLVNRSKWRNLRDVQSKKSIGLSRDQSEKSTALRRHQFDTDIDLRRDRFDTDIDLRRGYLDLEKDNLAAAKEQNRLATGIGIGNLAVTGLGGHARAKRQDNIDLLMQQYAGISQELVDMNRSFTQKYISIKG